MLGFAPLANTCPWSIHALVRIWAIHDQTPALLARLATGTTSAVIFDLLVHSRANANLVSCDPNWVEATRPKLVGKRAATG